MIDENNENPCDPTTRTEVVHSSVPGIQSVVVKHKPLKKRSRQALYREAIEAAVSPTSLRAVIKALVNEAKGGNVQAAKEVLDRCLGKAVQRLDMQIDAGANLIELTRAMDKASAPLPPGLPYEAEIIDPGANTGSSGGTEPEQGDESDA